MSKRTVLLMLAALVLVSVAIRYPLVEHERFQTDSYFIHGLADAIIDDGYAKWTVHSLSYFGFYPLSYASGVPFVLSELSTMTGLSVETCILLMDMSMAFLFCLTVFCLAREFVGRSELTLLAAFFAIVAPRFVDTTYWNGSARGTEVVLITLFVFVCFRASSTNHEYLWLVGGFLVFACFATHRMSVILVLYGVAFVLATLGYQYIVRLHKFRLDTRTNRIGAKRRLVVAALLILGTGIMLSTLAYFDLLGLSVKLSFGVSKHIDVDSPVATAILNASVAYTHQIGFILPVAFLGIVTVFRRSYLTMKSLFLVTILLSFVPVIGSSLYVSMLMAPFVSVLGVVWIDGAVRSRRRRTYAMIFVLFLIVGSAVLPVWSVQRWTALQLTADDTMVVDSRLFNDGNYLNACGGDEYAISNQERLYFELQSMSDIRFLKSGIRSAINGDVTGDSLREAVERSEVEFPNNVYSWFKLDFATEYFIEFFLSSLMDSGSIAANSTTYHEYASDHSHLYVVVDNRHPTTYTYIFGTRPNAPFLQQIQDATVIPSYMVYQSQLISVYVVQLLA